MLAYLVGVSFSRCSCEAGPSTRDDTLQSAPYFALLGAALEERR